MSFLDFRSKRSGSVVAYVFVLFAVAACSEAGKLPSPHTYFNKAFPKKGIDLTRALGSHIEIQDAGTAYEYHLEYYNADRITLITNAEGDTVYNDVVSKYRGLYFFQQTKATDRYWIGVMYAKDSLITGFLAIENQIWQVQDSLEHFKNMERNDWPEYLLQLDSSAILVNTDKRATYKLFNALLESSTPLVFRTLDETQIQENKEETQEQDAPDDAIENKLVARFGPLPANEHLKIFLKNKDPNALHSFLIHNLAGKEVYSEQVKGADHTVTTAQIPVGTYVFTVVSGKETWAQQFVIVH